MSVPAISIITPSFNQGQFIERTIQSVLDQDIDSLEYVVCDGGSTDNTLNILRKYDGRIRWFSEKDRGQTHAINKGLAMTHGDIVAYLNSDDIYYPGSLRSVVQFFRDHPELGAAYGNANHIDERDAVLEPYYTEDWNFDRLKEVCFLCQPAVFWRRTVTNSIGPFDESRHFCMDYEYWLRMAQSGVDFGYLRQTLAGSRLYPQTKTLGSARRVHAEINDMLKAKFGRVPDKWLFNFAHVQLQSRGFYRETRPVLFTLTMSALSLYAALRWNHTISDPMKHLVLRWLRDNLASR